MKRRDLLSFLIVAAAGCRPNKPSAQRQSQSPKSAATPVSTFQSVRIEGIPHIRQKPDFCGEAVVAMALRKLGQPHTQDDVFAASGMDPARGMGVTTRELQAALQHLGFNVGAVWHPIAAGAAEHQLEQLFAQLHRDLTAGVPSIICTRYDERPNTTEHFRLIVGYDAESDEVLYHEPAEDNGAYRRMSKQRMLALWPLKYRSEQWTVIRLRLDPQTATPKPQLSKGYSPAAFSQHVMGLRRTLPEGFAVTIEAPFVVVGDGGERAVKRFAAGTVRWAVNSLKRSFFDHDPARILNVWLFKDNNSYRRHTKQLFNDEPDTPYGYYSPSIGALVMNISTGGGTLVHEIVHPFMERNFPDCPAWINEGMGSLFEQSAERGGEIVGLPNWRLAGLQKALRRGRIPTFRQLSATSEHAFYEEDPGTNYSQARYLMYYLQEQGLLKRFYRAALKQSNVDRTGYGALVGVLGTSDMARFEQRWAAFVLRLRYPDRS